MRTHERALSTDEEEALVRRADQVCNACLAYERARLTNDGIDYGGDQLERRPSWKECIELEIEAEFWAADWDRYCEHHAGEWRHWCEPHLRKELERLEALGAQAPTDELTEAAEDTVYVRAGP